RLGRRRRGRPREVADAVDLAALAQGELAVEVEVTEPEGQIGGVARVLPAAREDAEPELGGPEHELGARGGGDVAEARGRVLTLGDDVTVEVPRELLDRHV